MKRKPRKCPHGKPVSLVTMHVGKLGPWEGKGPWGLFIYNTFSGGYAVAYGTRAEMFSMQRLVIEKFNGQMELAEAAALSACEVIPAHLRRMPQR